MNLRAILNKIKQRANLRKVKNIPRNILLPIWNSPGKYVFYCPGCDDTHIINTNPQTSYPYHTIRGSLIKPTIRASVLSKGDPETGKPRCHSFVTKGKIHFLLDSTHKLAGKIVSLKPM